MRDRRSSSPRRSTRLRGTSSDGEAIPRICDRARDRAAGEREEVDLVLHGASGRQGPPAGARELVGEVARALDDGVGLAIEGPAAEDDLAIDRDPGRLGVRGGITAVPAELHPSLGAHEALGDANLGEVVRER